ncbi:lipid II flippase MurJ [Streptomyces sp. B6B3]|uniref:murein biosynthesis integral membrane protein MurJ n=1 Tax=Streptomyces sp. B6B3 TaxID=3153570 RepID=UPI00325F2458
MNVARDTSRSARAAARGVEWFVVRAATAAGALTVAGALFGLLRDRTIARSFGAGGETDAFLVAWTVPEVASTLLIEEAMALVLVPAFSLALVGGPDRVRELVAATFPRLVLALTVAAALLVALAEPLVWLLAPGLAEPDLAVDCTRLTAFTVHTFGIAGYSSALLRAHRAFLPPAAIYIAYNVGIIAVVLALGGVWGVRAAAAGVAVGGLLMVLVQLPYVLRLLPEAAWPPRPCRPPVALAGLAVVAPVALFALTRQGQVLVERFLAAGLPSGAISHLNFAQKVAQMPMVLSMMICTVTLPLVARALAVGDTDGARRRVERDLTLAAAVVLTGAAYVVALAPQLVEVLFQGGEFGPGATVATARVMRVYALGLLGHTLVGTLVRPFFSAARPVWFPLAAMAGGLLVTIAAGLVAVRGCGWGAPGIAAANAVGITLTALVLLRGLRTRMVPVDSRRVLGRLLWLTLAAVAACAAGWGVVSAADPSAFAACGLGALVVPAVFAATAWPSLRQPRPLAGDPPAMAPVTGAKPAAPAPAGGSPAIGRRDPGHGEGLPHGGGDGARHGGDVQASRRPATGQPEALPPAAEGRGVAKGSAVEATHEVRAGEETAS